MSFQSNIQTHQGFGVPGEIFQNVPWTVLSYTLNSSGTPNVVGSTAYTITSEGFAQAGNGGTLGFAGILCAPKSYVLQGVDGAPLAATEEIPDFIQAELLTDGMMAVLLPASANIGDYVIYDNTTGALATMAPSDIIPSGFSSANAVVSQFTQSVSGIGIAVIKVSSCCGSSSAGQWPYTDTLWLASDGLDTNPGDSQDLPIATLLHAASLMTGPTQININGIGTYVLPSTFIVAHPLYINAPAATVQWTGGDSGTMFFLNTYSPVVANIGAIDAAGALQIFTGFSSCILTGPGGYCNIKSTAGVRVWEDANTLSPNGVPQAIFNISGDAHACNFLFKYSGTQIVNALNLGKGLGTGSNISSLFLVGLEMERAQLMLIFGMV